MRNVTTAATARARWAIAAVFAGNGLLISSLAVRTPSLKLDLGLTPGQLGLTAALFGVSAVLAMQLAGRVADRIGSAWILRLATPLLPVLLVGIGVAPGFGSLAVALVVFGAVHGLLDVAMNAHAVAVERNTRAADHERVPRGVEYRRRRRLATGIRRGPARCGAVVRTTPCWRRCSSRSRSPVGACWRWPGGTTTARRPPVGVADRLAVGLDAPDRRPRRDGGRRSHRRGGHRQLERRVPARTARCAARTAALGYAAFTACQTAVRLTGDRLRRRASATRLIRAGHGHRGRRPDHRGNSARGRRRPWPASP